MYSRFRSYNRPREHADIMAETKDRGGNSTVAKARAGRSLQLSLLLTEVRREQEPKGDR